MSRFGWALGLARRLGRRYSRKPRLIGFGVLMVLIVGLSVGAVVSGSWVGFWPSLLLNSAGDMIGGMVILLMIEPIVSRATMQIRQLPHLDYRLFARRIALAEREIRVLDTYSGLFDSAMGPRAMPALLDAVRRGVNVRVLLMSPSTDVSRLRQEQLESIYPNVSVDSEIHANMSALGNLEQELARTMRQLRIAARAELAAGSSSGSSPSGSLPPESSESTGDGEETGFYMSPQVVPVGARGEAERFGSFELRVYSVSAPFTLYQRDDSMIYTILPAYQYAHDAPQLEINARSLSGELIREKFDEVWENARAVRLLAPIRLASDSSALWVRYLEYNNQTYYASGRIDSALESEPNRHFWIGEHGDHESEAELVPPDTSLYRILANLHATRYTAERRRDPHIYQMRPLTGTPTPSGRTLAYDSLPTQEILDRLARAERSARILDTSSSLIGQNGHAAGAEAFENAALEALTRNATIRVLLLAPTTSASRERAVEIRDQHFDQMVERNIERLRHLGSTLRTRGIEPDRLQVRLYDQLPAISLHQMDDQVLVSFLPYRRRSSTTLQLETDRHSDLGEYAVGQFDQLWMRARPLDGLRYVVLNRPSGQGSGALPVEERLLVRTWRVGQTWFLASARIEELLASDAMRGGAISAQIEDVPDERFRLSDPLVRENNAEVWDAFARIYSASDPGVSIRALQQVG